jgi:predicted RNase H-like nuclease (RuvC/YqgF family)
MTERAYFNKLDENILWTTEDQAKALESRDERIEELEAAVLREKRRVDSLHYYINERDAEIARLRGVVQSVLDDATPETSARASFRIDSDVYWECFEVLQENSDE